MTSLRKTALVAGVLYPVAFVSSIPAFFLIEPVLTDPSYIVSSGVDTQITAGAFLDLVNALACIGTSVSFRESAPIAALFTSESERHARERSAVQPDTAMPSAAGAGAS